MDDGVKKSKIAVFTKRWMKKRHDSVKTLQPLQSVSLGTKVKEWWLEEEHKQAVPEPWIEASGDVAQFHSAVIQKLENFKDNPER